MSMITFIWLTIVCGSNLLITFAYQWDDTYKDCNITLDLSNTGLNDLNSNFLSNSSCVTNLILKNNNLRHLSHGTFNSQINLKYLDLSGNYLDQDDFFMFGGHETLKVILLNNQKDKTCFPSVHHIPHVFPHLEYLSLRQFCGTIVLNENFPKLKQLDMSDSKYIGLPNILNHMPETLTHLIIENVDLFEITNTYQLSKIVLLNVNRNRHPKDGYNSDNDWSFSFLSYMNNLQYLYMSDCGIDSIYNFPSHDNSQLKLLEFNISGNHISSIRDEVFEIFSSLASLDLSRNDLISMPNTISKLNNLTQLFLNEMRQESFFQSLEDFPEIRSLKTLSLQGNRLTILSETFFNKYPRLENLDLSYNHIKFFLSWGSQNSLRRLNLDSNHVSNLDDLSLHQTKSLKWVNVRNNSISSINVQSLKYLSKDLIIDV